MKTATLSFRDREAREVKLFRNRHQRKAEAQAAELNATQRTEREVIAHVTALAEEEYKKLLKKFTAHRELEKKLRAIEDGDIEDTAGLGFEV